MHSTRVGYARRALAAFLYRQAPSQTSSQFLTFRSPHHTLHPTMSIGESKHSNPSDTLAVSKNAMQVHELTTPLGKIGWIDDIFTTHWDGDKPISAGFFTVSAGEPLDYTYGYNELKLVTEGTVVLEDKTKGTKIVAHPGDVLSSTSSFLCHFV